MIVGVALFTALAVFILFDRTFLLHASQSKALLCEAFYQLDVVKEYRRKERAKRLQRSCIYEVPHMFDIVTLGLSAGLSFDASLTLYLERSNSYLAHELKQAQTMWTLGAQTREEALFNLAQELEAPTLKRFASAVVEALEFGVPLATTLSKQAQDIRGEQRAQAQEMIEKVPIEMLLPLGVLVVPAMLVAILGPLLSSALAI